jgi:hypothetical protein
VNKLCGVGTVLIDGFGQNRDLAVVHVFVEHIKSHGIIDVVSHVGLEDYGKWRLLCVRATSYDQTED